MPTDGRPCRKQSYSSLRPSASAEVPVRLRAGSHCHNKVGIKFLTSCSAAPKHETKPREKSRDCTFSPSHSSTQRMLFASPYSPMQLARQPACWVTLRCAFPHVSLSLMRRLLSTCTPQRARRDTHVRLDCKRGCGGGQVVGQPIDAQR